jgi:2-polyprenyl-6-methoxyphenol hydroxylase-like FAD-dependent oxidoreductase
LMERSAQVIVVGAGPVGLTAAVLLAQQGVSVLVLDARASASVEGSKAICIQRDSLDICARVGIADDMVAAGVTWWTGRTYFQDQELFHVDLPHDESQAFPPFINISQAATEALLVAQAQRHPLITLQYGTVVGSVQQDHSKVTAVFEGTKQSVSAEYLIGCDGSRSIVRRSIGATFHGRSFDEQFLIADIKAELPDCAIERRFYFDPPWNPGRQVLVHPCPDGVWRIDWQVPAEFSLDVEQSSGALDARIRMITGSNPYDIVWLSVYRFHQRRASTLVSGRVLLAGDSAHIYAPFGARGLNAGFHDAENAAWKVAALVHGWGGPHLLHTYDSERGDAADENLRVTSETMEFLVPGTDEARELRRSLLAAAETEPSMRSSVNSGRLAEPYWYNASPLTTDGSLVDFPTEPGVSRPLQAGVICPDAVLPDGTRLRARFGRGFIVVVSDPGDQQLEADSAGSVPVHTLVCPSLGLGRDCAVVRPDGFIAARVDFNRVNEALQRGAGHVTTR